MIIVIQLVCLILAVVYSGQSFKSIFSRCD